MRNGNKWSWRLCFSKQVRNLQHFFILSFIPHFVILFCFVFNLLIELLGLEPRLGDNYLRIWLLDANTQMQVILGQFYGDNSSREVSSSQVCQVGNPSHTGSHLCLGTICWHRLVHFVLHCSKNRILFVLCGGFKLWDSNNPPASSS